MLFTINQAGSAEALSSTPNESLIASIDLRLAHILPIDTGVLCQPKSTGGRHIGIGSFKISSLDDSNGDIGILGQSAGDDEPGCSSSKNDVIKMRAVDLLC